MNFLDLVKRTIRESGSHLEAPDSVEEATGLQERFVQWVRDAWAEIQIERTDWFFKQDETYVDIDPIESANDVVVLPSQIAEEFQQNWKLAALRELWIREAPFRQIVLNLYDYKEPVNPPPSPRRDFLVINLHTYTWPRPGS